MGSERAGDTGTFFTDLVVTNELADFPLTRGVSASDERSGNLTAFIHRGAIIFGRKLSEKVTVTYKEVVAQSSY